MAQHRKNIEHNTTRTGHIEHNTHMLGEKSTHRAQHTHNTTRTKGERRVKLVHAFNQTGQEHNTHMLGEK